MDRDGVINDTVDRGENVFVQDKKVRWTAPWRHDEFHCKDGVAVALEEFGKLGFLKILVTNQPDVVYGNMSQLEYDKIMADIKELSLDDIFVCMHGRDDGCECKKPKPGMLISAAQKWGIDLKKSFMVGDSESDIKASQAAGCKTILIDCAQNKNLKADARVTNLSEAVRYIHENIY
ncbi:MAG: histidinol-phosphate phosphatase family protein [Parcubacteria group bacterium GW2011_GWC1_44_10]|nr:MAG: histidinol-phosphate phosphatase family protein [Parcubacteria group bacterium GW2011_GWC1_44_10]